MSRNAFWISITSRAGLTGEPVSCAPAVNVMTPVMSVRIVTMILALIYYKI
jgi:hypothetical protein